MSVPSSTQKRSKPRGIWKAQRVIAPRLSARVPGPSHPPTSVSDNEDSDGASCSSDSTASKKQKHFYSSSEHTSDPNEEDIFYWDYLRRCSPYPDRVSSWVARTRMMDTSTTAGSGSQTDREIFNYEDWEDLKDLFAKAAEHYENDQVAEALPLLRGVIHECHRFLMVYEDLSVIFMNRPTPNDSLSPTPTVTSTEHRSVHDYRRQRFGSAPSINATSLSEAPKERKCKCVELPTAFHTILGTALFLLGNIIAQNPASALAGEPDNGVPFWLATLDVFETGESLPSQTSGISCKEAPEDWRMAIVWGRTLVCIADETVTRAEKAKDSQPESGLDLEEGAPSEPVAYFMADEPKWPSESPFSVIAARRPPVTCRMSLTTATPNDLMTLAMDQFSRGIFHMPHPRRMQTQQSSAGTTNPVPGQETFSRAKELFTIASEVLVLAEKLNLPSERQRWALWADSVFSQMKMEADMDAWRGPITRSRGRCWLIVGAARAEQLEAALEEGEMDILRSEDAEDAREALSNAISFFERTKSWASTALDDPVESRELQSLLAEALLNLANLTEDEKQREELYARAQLESGGDLNLSEDDGAMDESE